MLEVIILTYLIDASWCKPWQTRSLPLSSSSSLWWNSSSSSSSIASGRFWWASSAFSSSSGPSSGSYGSSSSSISSSFPRAAGGARSERHRSSALWRHRCCVLWRLRSGMMKRGTKTRQSWTSEGERVPKHLNLLFSCYLFSRKRFYLGFELMKCNFTSVDPLGKIHYFPP